ncbi:MAG: DUF4129 domain-containing protein [Chloroflexi bacterium]|nr:DUF4129 domain-containing protein [Chloroflexota bacterium]
MTAHRFRDPLLLLVEALWLFAAAALFVDAFGGRDANAPSFLAVGAAVAAGFFATRATHLFDIEDTTTRVATLIAGVIALAGIAALEYGLAPQTVAGTIAGVIALAGAVLRGAGRAGSPDMPGEARGIAALGLAVIGVAAITSSAAHGPAPFGVIGILYLAATLALFAVERAPMDRVDGSAAAGPWALTIAGVVAVAVVLAAVVAAIDPSSMGFLAPIGRPLARVAGFLVTLTLAPLFAALAWLFGLIPFRNQVVPQPTATPLATPRAGNTDTPVGVQIFGWLLAGGLGLLFAGSAVFVLWLLLARRKHERHPRDETRTAVEVERTLGDDLRSLLAAALSPFRRRRHVESGVAMRRLYARMLDRAERDALPRPTATTPLAFAPELEAAYGSVVPRQITDAYVRARYALEDVDAAEVEELAAAWDEAVAQRPQQRPA